MKVLVTGAAGFIGSHVCEKLLRAGHDVVGVDEVNAYYDVSLKEARLARLQRIAADTNGMLDFRRGDLSDVALVNDLFARGDYDRVIHLAAQAGVRYSLTHPHEYVRSNLVAFTNMLEACRKAETPHLVYASTSSVYGASANLPSTERHDTSHPLQFYAATKRTNELMAHSYSHLYRLPTTGLRFFTVYGPWGRPDMAFFLFTRRILAGEPVPIFKSGQQSRDFTYVDDVVRATIAVAEGIAEADPQFDPAVPQPDRSDAPFRIYNVGNSEPVPLLTFVDALEEAIGKTAIREYLPAQPGDAPDTFAETSALEAAVGFSPATPVKDGVRAFVDWYRAFYEV